MKTCFDANVLLETLLEGRKKTAAATAALIQAEEAAISALSVHLYVYFGQKEGYTLVDLLQDLQSYPVLAIDQLTTRWAAENHQGNDFEDALQIASAVLAGCDTFVTFDTQLAKNYGRFIDIQLPT